MSEIEVRIVRLEPMRVASFYGFGTEPEAEAHRRMEAYARPKGWLDGGSGRRVFGFNNPNPSAGSPNYGYELWVTLGADETPEGEVEVKEFGGGLYAVTRVLQQGDPYETIPAAWHRLLAWGEQSAHRLGSHQWLEEHFQAEGAAAGEWALDLYMPIAD